MGIITTNMMIHYLAVVWLCNVYIAVADPVCDPATISASQVVLQSSAAAYNTARAQWASGMGSQSESDAMLSPDAIVYCQNEDEVLETIAFANQCDYKLSIRSGGHQYSGYSSCEAGSKCLQLDVSLLNKQELDGTKVTFGAGTNLDQAYNFLLANGIFLPLGACKGVGLGGHFQSSSVGFMTKSFGLGMDRVLSFRLATAGGEILTVSPTSHPDLYKAVLGGGPGSWGVILEFTLDAYLDSDYPQAALNIYYWPYSHELSVKILNQYLATAALPEISRDFFMLLVIGPEEAFGNYPPATYTHYIKLYTTWTGVDGGTGPAPYLQSFSDIATPIHVVSHPMPLSVMTRTLTFTFDQGDFRYQVHSLITDSFDNPDFAEIVATEMDARLLLPTYYSSMQFQSYGGGGLGSQMNRNAGLNSYPLRDVKIIFDDWNFFLEDGQTEVAKERIRNFRKATKISKAWSPPSVDLIWMTTDTSNAQDADIQQLWKSYYPSREWYKNLQDVKLKVDPCDIFHTDMTVAVPGSHTGAGKECRLAYGRS